MRIRVGLAKLTMDQSRNKSTFALYIACPIFSKVMQETPVGYERDMLLRAAVNPVTHLSSPLVNGRQVGSINSFL
jgi:hypothetical protein